MSVVWPAAARRKASDADRLVLPTPPLPLTCRYTRKVEVEVKQLLEEHAESLSWAAATCLYESAAHAHDRALRTRHRMASKQAHSDTNQQHMHMM